MVDGEHGVQQQTREHLLIASHMGTKRFVVFIDCKSDSVDDETLQLIEMDIRDMFDSKSIPLDKVALKFIFDSIKRF